MSAVNDNVLRPWAQVLETDAKLDAAIASLNAVFQVTAPQKFGGQQGYSSLDRIPDELRPLYEYVQTHPDWVDAVLDEAFHLNPEENPGYDRATIVALTETLRGMQAAAERQRPGTAATSLQAQGVGSDTILADREVLAAAMNLGELADVLGPDYNLEEEERRYFEDGTPIFESDALRRHRVYNETIQFNKDLKRKTDKRLKGAIFRPQFRLSPSPTQSSSPIRKEFIPERYRKKKPTVNIMMVNAEDEEYNDSEPMLSETEFLDKSFDLLTGAYKDGRPSTSSGRLRAESSLGATDFSANSFSPTASETLRPLPQSSLHRPPTAADSRTMNSFSRPSSRSSLAAAAAAVSSASYSTDGSLPAALPRLQAAHSASDLYSRGTTPQLPHQQQQEERARRPHTSAGRASPSLSSSSVSNRLGTPSASRFDEARAGAALGGLAVLARPQSKTGRQKAASTPTVYSDVMGMFKTEARVPNADESHTYGKPFCHRELSDLRSIRDRIKTVNGRMLAASVELGAIVDDEEQEIIKKLGTGVSGGGVPFKKTVLLPMNLQRQMTLRGAAEAAEAARVDVVDGLMRGDAYDKVVSPERLYMSETKRFIKDDESFKHMRNSLDKTYHVKLGELQEWAAEAQRLGKRPFNIEAGGMKI